MTRAPNPPIAFLLSLAAKFLSPSSSAPEGGPLGCLLGKLACRKMTFVAIAGLPIPTPSYCFLTSLERDEWAEGGVDGVLTDVGEPFEEPEDPSSSAVLVSIVTVGSGDDTATLKRSGCGRVLAVGDISSMEGELGLTLVLRGGVAEAERNTELLVVALPLRQETAASDLEGAGILKVVAVGVPRDVPPLITVVRLGVGGTGPVVELTGTIMDDSSS